MKNLSKAASQKVYKVSLNSTAHQTERFYKRVWGIFLLLLAVIASSALTL